MQTNLDTTHDEIENLFNHIFIDKNGNIIVLSEDMDIDQLTPIFHEIISSGNLTQIESLLKLRLINNILVNCKTKEAGWTALHTAAFCGNKKLVEILLQYGAQPIKNQLGKSPLDLAPQLSKVTID